MALPARLGPDRLVTAGHAARPLPGESRTLEFASIMSAFGGGLNRSTQHFILKRKGGVHGDESKISSRFHCGRENVVVGPLAAWGVSEGDWASVW